MRTNNTNNTNNTSKVYGVFYKSHGTWTPYSKQTFSLSGARQAKRYVQKTYKSSAIVRKVKFV